MKKLLSSVQIQRDLGVMISNNLSWNENSNWRATKAMCAFFQIESFAEMCYHNEIERMYWLRSTHPNLCLPDMATKQNKSCNTRESSKIGDSLDLGSRKKLLRKNERAEAPLLSLYMEMHDILM